MAADKLELEELNDTLNGDRHTLTDKNDELKQKLDDAAAEKDALKRELVGAAAEKDALKRELVGAAAEKDALKRELKGKIQELKDAEARRDNYKDRLDQDDRKAHQQRDEMTEKYKELKKGMKTKLETMRQELGEHWQGVHLKKLATTKRVIMADVLEAVVEDVLTEFRRRKTDDDTVENIMNVLDSGLRKAMLAAYEKALPQEPPPVGSPASRKTKKKKRTRRRRGRR